MMITMMVIIMDIMVNTKLHEMMKELLKEEITTDRYHREIYVMVKHVCEDEVGEKLNFPSTYNFLSVRSKNTITFFITIILLF